MDDDKRSSHRYKFTIPMLGILRIDGEEYPCDLVDISETGARFAITPQDEESYRRHLGSNHVVDVTIKRDEGIADIKLQVCIHRYRFTVGGLEIAGKHTFQIPAPMREVGRMLARGTAYVEEGFHCI